MTGWSAGMMMWSLSALAEKNEPAPPTAWKPMNIVTTPPRMSPEPWKRSAQATALRPPQVV